MTEEEKAQPIRNSDSTSDCMRRLVRAIEDWANKEANRGAFELNAFGVALSKNIINFSLIRPSDLRSCKRIQTSIGTVLRHLDRQKDEMNSKIDQMHVRFAQEIEELDLRIVRDRKEFRRYVDTVRHAEEFGDLHISVKQTADNIDAQMMGGTAAPLTS